MLVLAGSGSFPQMWNKAASLLIRADATPRMGTGHVMRCLALAQAAREAGMNVRLICRPDVDWLRTRLEMDDVPLHFLPDAPPNAEYPADLLSQLAAVGAPIPGALERTFWVVLDGYHFRMDCQKALIDAGYGLLVIDDYAHLPEYHCHILLNQNVNAQALPYTGVIGRTLLGPAYALLRQEFLDVRRAMIGQERQPKELRLLVTLGGGDFSEDLEAIAAQMDLPGLKGCTVRVLQGAMDAKRVSSAFANCPARVELVPRVDHMPPLMQNTDLCITAGGCTCWELCCLGVPFLTVEVAPNQHGICSWLAKNRFAPRFSRDMLSRMLDQQQRMAASNAVRALVDGAGAAKVVRCLQSATAGLFLTSAPLPEEGR